MQRLSLALLTAPYLISFALPAMRSGEETAYGYQLFFGGVGGLLFGWGVWLANPLYWTALVMGIRGEWKGAFIYAMGAALLCGPQLLALGHEGVLLHGAYVWFATFPALSAYAACRAYTTDSRSFLASGSIVVMVLLAFLALFILAPRWIRWR